MKSPPKNRCIKGYNLTRRQVLKLMAAGLMSAQLPTLEAASMMERMSALILKILSFDRSLKEPADKPLILTVVANVALPTSLFMGRKMCDALNKLGQERKITVHGRAVEAITLEIAQPEEATFRDSASSVVLMGPGLGDVVESLGQITRKLQLPTLCGKKEWVQEHLAVALVAEESPPKIMINLDNAKAAGMKLDPRLLKLAEVV